MINTSGIGNPFDQFPNVNRIGSTVPPPAGLVTNNLSDAMQMPQPADAPPLAQMAAPQFSFQDAQDYTKSHIPDASSLPQFERNQGPHQNYQDLLDEIQTNAMHLSPPHEADPNEMDPDHPIVNMMKLGAIALNSYAQMRLLRQRMQQPISGYGSPDEIGSRSGSRSHSGISSEDAQANAEAKHELDSLETQAKLANYLSQIEQHGQEGYAANALGGNRISDMYNDRAKLAPEIYNTLQQGESHRTAALQNIAETKTIDQNRPNVLNAESELANEHKQLAFASNQRGLSTQEQRPSDLTKSEQDAKKSGFEAISSESEARYSDPYRAAQAKNEQRLADTPVKSKTAADPYEKMDYSRLGKQLDKLKIDKDKAQKVYEQKQGAFTLSGTVKANKDKVDAIDKQITAIDKQMKSLRSGGQSSTFGDAVKDEAPAPTPTPDGAKAAATPGARPGMPEGATGKAMKNGVQVGWIVNATPIDFDGKPLPPAGR